jgi:hypothetical protein
MLAAGAIVMSILGLSEPITAVNAQNVSITEIPKEEVQNATTTPPELEATTNAEIEGSTTTLDNNVFENATTSTTTAAE